MRVGLGDGLREVITGHRLAVKALKIQLHSPLKPCAAGRNRRFAAHQRLHHAHHLCALFVNGDGVEVVDFNVAVRPHRVGHGARVLRELGNAQHAHVLNALDGAGRCAGAQVHAEFLVAEHGQAFFQAQLEPVAAGDAVAGPVVEVLMAYDRLDIGKVDIGGRGLVGQHILGVEDVQALVLHRAHVEVAGGNNHETLQIQR